MSVAVPSQGTGGLLRIATAGSVDDGKSTLIGRLLYDSKEILADQLAHIADVSARRGLDTIEKIIAEVAVARVTERGATRGDDRFSEAAMEDRKKEGYF